MSKPTSLKDVNMPRTLEGILKSHRIATERRKAGRPVWDRKLDIKRFLNHDDTSEESAAATANKIGAYLRKHLADRLGDDPGQLDVELEDIVEQLEQLRAGDFKDDPTWSALQDLNTRLDELYDWADGNRVWLG